MKHKKHAKQVLKFFVLLVKGPFEKIRAHALKVNARFDGPEKGSERWDEVVKHVRNDVKRHNHKKRH